MIRTAILLKGLKKWIVISFFALFSSAVLAAPNSNGTTTNWYTGSGWSCSCVPDLTFWAGTTDVVVAHNKSANSLTITNGNSIQVNSGATLTINGNLTLGSSSSILVQAGGTLVITGSLLANNSPTTVTINGTLSVGGNYSVSTSSNTHNLNGVVNVAGNFSMTGNTTANVTGGQITVNGQLSLTSNAIMTGCSGWITYGSYNIGSCGFSYLRCCGNNRGTGCGTTAPPANGLNFATCGAVVSCSVGPASSSPTVCVNTAMTNITHATTGVTGVTSSSNLPAGVTATYAANTLTISGTPTNTGTFNYDIILTGCATHATGTITVNAASVGGTVTSDATVCSGSNSGTLTLAGYTGSITKWQSSTNNFVSSTDISNTSASQSYTNITATTKYRAVITSGVCASANSAAATITVDAASVGGTVTADATVCTGSNSGTLTLAGYTGSITKWQSSTNNFASSTDIANTTSSQSYTNITSTTKYRAVIKSGVCASANSSAATITVDAASVGGTVTSDATVCSGSNSGTLTLAGYTGSITKWQLSTDNFATSTDIANTTTSQSYSNLTATTKYRAVITSGVCASANSAAATITVNALPVVALTLIDDAACVDEAAFNLGGGTPLGGTYSGTGVGVSPSFNPGTAGVGSHTITYTYTDGNGCTNTATDAMTVNALPVVALTLTDDAACVDEAAFNLGGGTPLGGTYSGTGVGVSPSFNPGTAGAGSHTITYTYTNGNGCTNTATDAMTVNALPVVTLTLTDDAACVSEGAFNLGGGAPLGGTYSGTGVGVSPSFNPATAGVGSHTITYTYTDGNGCTNTATDGMTVNALPVVTLTLADDAACVSEAAFN
ncbi:MAG: beta strand repeat-containing protein, partial [Flavobacteriales bacterium]